MCPKVWPWSVGRRLIRIHRTSIGAPRSITLKVIDLGAPMDVLWMRISRRPTDQGQTFGHIVAGKMLVLLNREDYWQCAFVIPKGKGEEVLQKGLESFREQIATLEPFLRDRVTELRDWE